MKPSMGVSVLTVSDWREMAGHRSRGNVEMVALRNPSVEWPPGRQGRKAQDLRALRWAWYRASDFAFRPTNSGVVSKAAESMHAEGCLVLSGRGKPRSLHPKLVRQACLVTAFARELAGDGKKG